MDVSVGTLNMIHDTVQGLSSLLFPASLPAQFIATLTPCDVYLWHDEG